MKQTRLAIHGAAGRMGQRLVALAQADPALAVAAALESPQHPRMGEDAGLLAGIGPIGVKLSPRLEVPADVVIDFSVPGGGGDNPPDVPGKGTARWSWPRPA